MPMASGSETFGTRKPEVESGSAKPSFLPCMSSSVSMPESFLAIMTEW